jgi:hypothetical protein
MRSALRRSEKKRAEGGDRVRTHHEVRSTQSAQVRRDSRGKIGRCQRPCRRGAGRFRRPGQGPARPSSAGHQDATATRPRGSSATAARHPSAWHPSAWHPSAWHPSASQRRSHPVRGRPARGGSGCVACGCRDMSARLLLRVRAEDVTVRTGPAGQQHRHRARGRLDLAPRKRAQAGCPR